MKALKKKRREKSAEKRVQRKECREKSEEKSLNRKVFDERNLRSGSAEML